MSNKILITGAGGAVGSVSDLIIKHLVARGQDVRAFMRPTNQKDKEIEALEGAVCAPYRFSLSMALKLPVHSRPHGF
ncbi:hypothetical protein [Actinobacillus porcitonsillarum]|uniref:hypothetical protein n=1 Tax=Actinobacillus porcitonsillarum TaxID=189834 RepID=UPI0013005003|nr:hypothetical protein [Actinobacillus porcitonsillarum]